MQIVTKEATLALPIAGVIDVGAESERLKREISRVYGEIEQLDRKLSDEKFTSRAPEHVVEENRERRNQAAAAAVKPAGCVEAARSCSLNSQGCDRSPGRHE